MDNKNSRSLLGVHVLLTNKLVFVIMGHYHLIDFQSVVHIHFYHVYDTILFRTFPHSLH